MGAFRPCYEKQQNKRARKGRVSNVKKVFSSQAERMRKEALVLFSSSSSSSEAMGITRERFLTLLSLPVRSFSPFLHSSLTRLDKWTDCQKGNE